MEPAVEVAYDPFSAEAMSNPWPLYADLRREGSAHRLERYNAWALPRFADVWDVLADLDSFSIVDGPIFEQATLETTRYGRGFSPRLPDPLPGFVSLDPPLHTRLRQSIGGVLRPRAVGRLTDEVRRLARDRLDALVPDGRFDARQDYAGPVSAAVMCLVAGVSVADAPVMQDLANASLQRADGRPGLPPAALEARAALDGLLMAAIRRCRTADPGKRSSMIEALIAGKFAGRYLTDAEIVAQVRGIVTGGVETVPKVVSAGLLELWRTPDQRAAVGHDPARCTTAVEEMIRFGGPLQWVGRTLRRDGRVAGIPMRAGERLLLLIASANRDEREFPDPDRFWWNRPMSRHLGFGQGHHHCIGAHVARLEGRILVEELLRRLPEYEIDESGIERPPSEFQVGYTRMPLVVS